LPQGTTVSSQDYSQPAMKAVFPALDGFGLSLAPDSITAKRVLDVALATIAILLFLPLFAAITLAVSLDSRGPVLFRQRRAGQDGQLFGIFKFRSMHVLEDGSHVVQATKGDPRITRVGRFLRAASLDELPQLFNVLSGEMSLVGPRPHAIAHDEYYSARVKNYAVRQQVKPGITGWAQVNGARGATADVADMQHRIELDAWYVAHESLWLDLVILARTPLEVLRCRNAV
jgi:putative colanic acid biosynthesis UDP-glucose lipid carrier transferase